MSKKKYSRELRMKVAKEAAKPESKGMEHIIAKKYNVMPWTVSKWCAHYLEYGEEAFKKGLYTSCKKSAREIELEKRVAELEMETEILKKATAFLSNVKHE